MSSIVVSYSTSTDTYALRIEDDESGEFLANVGFAIRKALREAKAKGVDVVQVREFSE